jgi:hypothetical protein
MKNRYTNGVRTLQIVVDAKIIFQQCILYAIAY